MRLIIPRKEKGQSVVELAIILPLLLIILLGIIDFGRVFYAYVTVTNASREGARYGALHPGWIDESDNADPNNVKFHAIQEAANTVTILPEDITVITDTNTITVTAQADFQAFFFGNLPYIRDFFPQTGVLPIVARSTFPIAQTLSLNPATPVPNTPTPTHTPTLTPTPLNCFIDLIPSYGFAPSTFNVLGYQFASGETVQIYLDDETSPRNSGPVGGDGTFALPVTIDAGLAPGDYYVKANTLSCNATDLFSVAATPTPTSTPTITPTPTTTPTPTPTFTPTPTPNARFIVVNPDSVAPGGTTTVYGYNFDPVNDNITIEMPASTCFTPVGPFKANPDRTFSQVITICPDETPGAYLVLARWGTGTNYVTADLLIVEEPPTPTPTPTSTPAATPTPTATATPTATPTHPYLILSPDTGRFSQVFAIEGHNLFTSTLYSLYWESLLFATVSTDGGGNFSGITYTVPVAIPGVYTVEAQDSITATAPFTVIAYGAIEGTTYVSFAGSYPGEPTAGVQVAAYQGGELVASTFSVSDPLGHYSLSDLPTGDYYVKATYTVGSLKFSDGALVTVTGGKTTLQDFSLF
jgi:Flp pilus assembly protein TadG